MSGENNNQSRLLVYGSTGFLGEELIKELKKKGKSFTRGLARIENRDELLKEIDLIKPDRIICMAGLPGKPNISWFEANQIEGIRINILGQLNVADVANLYKIHCTLLSTGVIYTYDDNHQVNSGIGFKEEDEPNYSGNFYSFSRIIEEKLLKSYLNVLNLRISYPTTSDQNPNSFLSKLISFEKIQSVPLSITVVDDLWPILIDLSEKNITGTFNFNNYGTITHQEILEMYKFFIDENHQYEIIRVELTKRGACELDVSKLMSLGYNIPNVKESFKRLFEKYKENKENKTIINKIVLKKKILVIGARNYIIFKSLTNLIKSDQFDFIVVDKYESIDLIKELETQNLIEYFQIDLCSKSTLCNLFKKYKFQAVIHIQESERKTESEIDPVNLMTHLNIAQCMSEHDIKNLIVLDSGEQSKITEEFIFKMNNTKKDWNLILIGLNLFDQNKLNESLSTEDLLKSFDSHFSIIIMYFLEFILRSSNILRVHEIQTLKNLSDLQLDLEQSIINF